MPGRRRATTMLFTGLLAGGLALTGCTNSGNSSGTPASAPPVNDSQNAQQVQTPSASASAGSTCSATDYGSGGVKKLDLSSATVGFSQSEATSNPFRATETNSITTEAKKLGVKLIQRNANADVNQQNQDIQALIAQGAQALIVAPENSSGLAPSLAQAKAKEIPVLTIDRTVTGKACQDFIGFIGSDFEGQAVIAANDMGDALGGKGKVAILQGTPGNNVATARTDGFVKTMKSKYPGISVVASQTANFDQATGQKVAAQILQSNSDLTGIYAENDSMALGAIQAIKAAGKKPGTDVKVVGIDGIKEAVQDVADGTMVSTIETNPRFGPLAFDTLKKFYSGTGAPTNVVIADQHFTSANAADALKNGQVY